MMSLSRDKERVRKGEKAWTKFEMEPLESSPPSVDKDEERFVSFQVAEEEGTDFVPLNQEEEDGPKRLEEAEEAAEDVLKAARERAALLEQEAYEKGFAQGERDGQELGEKKAAKVTEHLEKVLTEIGHLKERVVREHEKEILDLLFAMAEKITHILIKSDQTAIKDCVLSAILLAAQRSKIEVRVNPDDLDYIEKIKPEFLIRFKEMKSVSVTSDPSITRGGCFLKTPYGDVDARIETQLEKMHQCLEEAFTEKEDGWTAREDQMD